MCSGAWAFWLAGVACCAAAEARSGDADPAIPTFRVEADGFSASEADIRAVVESTGRELWRFFPGYRIEPFVIMRGRGGPVVLFERNSCGEIVIQLDTQRTYWSQYAYQFAHEFCHILCGLDEDTHKNKWFEETLCETASLFALRAMAEAWADDPPYPHWREFRHALRKYADDVIAKRDGIRETHGRGMASFYLAHQAELEQSPGLRELNGAMSIVLLRLFEQQPEHWEAVRWLNASGSPKGETFQEHLRRWRDAAPNRHKPFIRRIADLYGIEID